MTQPISTSRHAVAASTGLLEGTAQPWRPTTGPLDGWSVAVKDLFDVAGGITTAGSAVLADADPAAHDAEVVRRFRAAGASYVGRTAMHEFAFGVTGVNAWQGTPDNPADPGRIPGGSSSGSAVAVASGAARVALGTDTGGSVRIPAALCGVVGLKLPWDDELLRGVVPLAPTLDHVGFFTRDLDDLEVVTASICGEEARAAELRGTSRLVWTDGVSPEPDAAPVFADVRDALASAAEVTTTRMPPPLSDDVIFASSTVILFHEAASWHRSLLAERSHLYGADVFERLVTGAAMDLSLYRAALASRARAREALAELLAGCDALVLPTVPCRPPVREAAGLRQTAAQLVANTRLANLTGHPAITLPIPASPHPMGIQLVARDLSTLLAAARVVERALLVSADRGTAAGGRS